MVIEMEDLEPDLNKLCKYIIYSINHEDLKTIFKKFFHAIIKYKESNNEIAIENLGEFIEHSHRQLFTILNQIINKPIDYTSEFSKNKYIVKFLKEIVFPELNLLDIQLIDQTRETHTIWSKKKHEYRFHRVFDLYSVDFNRMIVESLKLYLLTQYISYLNYESWKDESESKKREYLRKKSICIQEGFPILFQEKNERIIQFFIDLIRKKEISDLMFERGIIEISQIINSSVLQNLFPYVLLEKWNIFNILNSKIELPFRSDGPHIIDYENDNWIFIPKIANKIINCLQRQKSVHIIGPSGSGKTVLTRYLGYYFLGKNITVYYFDFLKIQKDKIQEILRYLFRLNLRKIKFENSLFIFENVHILEASLKSEINIVKKNFLSVINSRHFLIKNNYPKSFHFSKNLTFKLGTFSNDFKDFIRGLLNKNHVNEESIEYLLSLKIANLWIYGIFLKIYKSKYSDYSQSFIKVLSDPRELSKELTIYFKNLIQYKDFDLKTAEIPLFLNYTRFLLSVISLLSEYEVWLEYSFLIKIFAIRDGSPLGRLNSRLKIRDSDINNILSILIDLHEINIREFTEGGIIENEYLIPHSQMATIFKNTIFEEFEEKYKGLKENIIYLYLFHGKNFGTYLYNRNMLGYRAPYYERVEKIKKTNFDFNKFNSNLTSSNLKLYLVDAVEKLKKQILRTELDEINKFLDSLPYDYDKSLCKQIYIKIFDIEILGENIWHKKILNSNSKTLFSFVREIKWWHSNAELIKFLIKFNSSIISILKKNGSESMFDFISLLLDIPISEWNTIIDDIRNLLKEIHVSNENQYHIKSFISKVQKSDVSQIFASEIENLIYDFIKVNNLNDILLFANNNKKAAQIFIEFLKQILESKTNNTKKFIKKLASSELYQLSNLLHFLDKKDENLCCKFFDQYLYLMKIKLTESKYRKRRLFFMNFTAITIPKVVRERILLDWGWLINLLRDLSLHETIWFKAILFEDLIVKYFPNYIEKFKHDYSDVLELKLIEYNENLKDKSEIVDYIGHKEFDKKLNKKIALWYEELLLYYLKNKKFDTFRDKIYLLSNKTDLKKSIMHYLNFNRIVNSNAFKTVLRGLDYDQFAEMIRILIENFKIWPIMLINSNKHLLELNFGENFKEKISYDDVGRYYLDNLEFVLGNMRISEINNIYNGSRRTDEDILFHKLNDSLASNPNTFFVDEMNLIISKLEITELFNFLIILKKFHPNILHSFIDRFKSKILETFQDSILNIDYTLKIITLYSFTIDIITFLDHELNSTVFKRSLKNGFEEYDIFAVKIILEYIIRKNLTKEFNQFLKELNLNFELIFKNSSIDRIAIAYFSKTIWISRNLYLLNNNEIEKTTSFITFSEENINTLYSECGFYLEERANFGYYPHMIVIPKPNFLIFDLFLMNITPLIAQIKLQLSNGTLLDYLIFLKCIVSFEDAIQEKTLLLKNNFLDLVLSDKFIEKIIKSDFNTIYLFFKILNFYFPEEATSIFISNIEFFEGDSFWSILEQKSLNIIVDLIFHLIKEPKNATGKLLLRLKRILQSKSIIDLFQSFRILNNDKLNFLINAFKKEINFIIGNSSRMTLKKALGDTIENPWFKIEEEKLDLLKSKLPNIEAKLKEKYVIEPAI